MVSESVRRYAPAKNRVDFTGERPDFTQTLKEWTERTNIGRGIANALIEGEQAKAELKRVTEQHTALRAGIERLRAKMAQASQAVPDVTKHLEQHADYILARRDDIMNRSDKVCAPHAAMMDETDHSLDDLESVLQVMGNGAPLPSGESSQG